jgi:hypothetical protein
MIALATIFADAETGLTVYLQALAKRLDANENVWVEYRASLETLKRLVGEERLPVLTTEQAAQKFQVSPRTIRAKGARLGLEAVRSGKAGRAAIRWRSA